MDAFCGSEFWNLTVTWYTNDPDFTECFQKTVLVWVPCAFLWMFSPLEAFYISNSKSRNIQWNWLNVSKLFLTCQLILLSIVDICSSVRSNNGAIHPVDYCTPLIKCASLCLAAILSWYNKKRGLRVSGLLFLFWFFLMLFGIVQFRNEIRKEINGILEDTLPSAHHHHQHITYLIYFPIVVILTILNSVADEAPTISKYETLKNPCPEQAATFPSRLFFSWFDRMVLKGYRQPLEAKDLWDMNPEDTVHEITTCFDKNWKKSVEKCHKTSTSKVSFHTTSASVDFSEQKCKKTGASVLPALCKTFGATFLFGSFLKLVQDLLNFASPQILKLLLTYIAERNELEVWKGYFYAILMFLAASLQTLFLSQYFNKMFMIGLRIRSTLVSTIYRKALRLSNGARKESTVGEIVNLMSVDAQRFMDVTAYLNMLWSAPLQISLALYFLWDTLGPSVLAGLAIMMTLIPVNAFVSNRIKHLQIQQMKYKDERIKIMNEVLNGIKVLKLYAWEPSFEQKVLKIRENEIHILKQTVYLQAVIGFCWACAPFLISLVTFATYVLIDENNVLTPAKAFVSLALFNIIKMPLSTLPMIVISLVQTSVSVKRMNKFMNAEELDSNNVTHDYSKKDPLMIENGTFSWGPEEDPVLKNINLQIKEGSLVAVVGTVGSGKSSLISALLGEMDKLSGSVNTKGSIAYIPQQAWIQNATLKENIIFGKFVNETQYKIVIEACALKPDIEMLPAGDQTEIGEKGINLSGGQKQRVSLARSVIYDADIYFLDDPLSAVDSHVGRHIFDNVFGPNGLLKNKTRVLVTHSITYLPEVDKIFVLRNGAITETGTYKNLLEKKGDFADFLLQYLHDGMADDASQTGLDEIKTQLEGANRTKELKQQLSRTVSQVSQTQKNSNHFYSTDEKHITPERNALQRQTSMENNSDKKSLKQLSSIKEELSKSPMVGQKLIETEKLETGNVKWTVYLHYLKSIGLMLSGSAIGLKLLFQGFSIGTNVWLKKWSEEKNVNDSSIRDMYLSVYSAFGVGQVVSVICLNLVTFLGALKAAYIIHLKLLKNIMRNPISFFDVTPAGRILNRFSKDLDVLDSFLPLLLKGFMSRVVASTATIIVISCSTPIFTSVIVPIGILYYFVQRFYVATSRQLNRLESASKSPIYSHFSESLIGASTIRAYNVQAHFITESEKKIDNNQICYFPTIVANRWLAVRLEIVGNLITFFAALFAVMQQDIDEGTVGLSLSYALQITEILNWLVRMASDVETNIVAVERIKEYEETNQEASWDIPSTAPSNKWPHMGEVIFKNYEMRYREGLDLVLKRISFSVNGGEKVGIVGRTGAGKSSLTLALFRIIEGAGGTITIDGHDISQMGLHALRSRLTIIPQDPVLFSGTLRINLDPFNKYTDDEVWRALELAHLRQFAKCSAAGLNHEIAEGGENLSMGQRQLICLARALLRKTQILVLDEATAAVDLETDDLIQSTIRREFRECTILTIAHRLNTIMDSDRVLVLDKGSIVEYDSPNALLQKRNTIFYRMAKDAGLV